MSVNDGYINGKWPSLKGELALTPVGKSLPWYPNL